MQRCAAVTSVTELLMEVESVLEYLKCHDGIADPPDHLNEHIIEDATSIPMSGDTNMSPAARAAAANMRGGIPSANPIDTPTVNATPAPRLRMVQNILDNEPPRPMHNANAQIGHSVHPSKVQRLNPQVNLNTSSTAADPPTTFLGMSTYNTYVRDAPIGELQNPFAPLRQGNVGYNLTRDIDMSSDNTSRNHQRWSGLSRMTGRGGRGMKGKFKPNKKGKRALDQDDRYNQIPEFGKASGDAKVVLFTLSQLYETRNPYRKKLPVHQERSRLPGGTVPMPDTTFVAARMRHDQQADPGLCKVYHNALGALYDANRSTSNYLLRDETGATRSLLGLEVQYLNGQSVNELISENQKTSLGDYWRVLRLRPPTNSFSAERPHLEYIPNSTYSYYEVKMTLENVKRLKVKPSRYWNELPIKDVQSDILYSLSDYCPGLPYEANIIRDNESLGLPIYRIRELVFYQDQAPPVENNVPDEDRSRKRVDAETTISNLVALGSIPDQEQLTLQDYMIRVEETLSKYEMYLQEWPFLVAQRLLKMQVSRLRFIKSALIEKLDNHPLSTANTAVFGSDQNQGNPPAGYDSMAYFGSAPANADISSQSGEMMGNNSQSADRSGQTNPSGRGW